MKSLEELKAIREKMQGSVALRNEDSDQTRVVVGMATCGIAQTGCIGLCQYEPIVEVYEPGKEKVTYVKMTPDKALEVVNRHLNGGQPIKEYTLNSTTL